MHHWRPVLLGLALLASRAPALAQDAVAVRLAFVLNFARFVEWPEASLKPAAPLRICLAPGDAAMAVQFGELTRQSVQGRTIQTRLLARPTELDGCHVVFVPADLPGSLPSWLDTAMRAGALTVGDLPDFIERGGMIGLVPFGGRYRFAVNLGVARQADLRLSSHLLNLAVSVK